jgi:sulfide:quinone oxidoreductase
MRIVIVGAGFGGLEIATCLSETLGGEADVTLIDKNGSFVLGYAKLDVMFGRTPPAAIHLPYRAFAKRGVTFRQELVTALDPAARRVVTDRATYDADILVVALGADYDVAATPGLAEGGHEFYSVAGAKTLRDILPAFQGGTVVVGVMTPHYKCPPLPSPIPVSKAAGDGILARFAELGIECISGAAATRLDAATRTLHLSTGDAVHYDLLLAVPVHVAPRVVLDSGLAVDGWIPVEKGTLRTRFPDVYAVGDVTSGGTSAG